MMQQLMLFCPTIAERLHQDATEYDVRWPMVPREADAIFADPAARDALLLRGCEVETGTFSNLRRLIRDYDLAYVCPDFYRRHTLTPETFAALDDDALEDLEALLMKEHFELQNKRGIVWVYSSEELEKKTLRRPPGRPDSGAQYLCHLLALVDLESTRRLILIGYARTDVPKKPSEPTKSGLRVPTPLDGLGLNRFEVRTCDKRGGVTASDSIKGGVREAVHPGAVLQPSLVVITDFSPEDALPL